jgi:hypothetical protein
VCSFPLSGRTPALMWRGRCRHIIEMCMAILCKVSVAG